MTTPISPFRRGTGSYCQVSHLAAWSASKDDRESGLGTGLVSGVRSPSIPRVQKTARGTALERAVAADTSAIKASTDGRVPSDAIVSPSSPSSEALPNQRWRGRCRRTRGLGISAQWLRFRPLGVEVPGSDPSRANIQYQPIASRDRRHRRWRSFDGSGRSRARGPGPLVGCADAERLRVDPRKDPSGLPRP